MRSIRTMAVPTLGGVLVVLASRGAAAQAHANAPPDTTRATARPRGADCPPGCTPAAGTVASGERHERAATPQSVRRRRGRPALDHSDPLARAQERAETERLRREQAERAQARTAQLQAQTAQALAKERAARLQLEAELVERERATLRTDERRGAVARGGGPLPWRPMFTAAVDAGVGAFGGQLLPREVYTGGTWGVRVGVDFFDWLGLEARYFGMANALYAPAVGAGTALTNGGSAVLRWTAPIPWVQPYVLTGVGGYHTAVQQSTQSTAGVLRSQSYLVFPIGFGLNVPLGRYVAVGVESDYHVIVNTADETNTSWNQTGIWTGSAVVRFRL
jgi:hypothetical protein